MFYKIVFLSLYASLVYWSRNVAREAVVGADVHVVLESGLATSLSNLRVGDSIECPTGWCPVLAFLHSDITARSHGIQTALGAVSPFVLINGSPGQGKPTIVLGHYMPLVASGEFIVQGQRVSCYNDASEWMHLAFAPVRLWSAMAGSKHAWLRYVVEPVQTVLFYTSSSTL